MPGCIPEAKVYLFNLYNKVQMSCLVVSSLRCTAERIGSVMFRVYSRGAVSARLVARNRSIQAHTRALRLEIRFRPLRKGQDGAGKVLIL